MFSHKLLFVYFSTSLKVPLSHLHGHQTMQLNMLNFLHCHHLLPVSIIAVDKRIEPSEFQSKMSAFLSPTRGRAKRQLSFALEGVEGGGKGLSESVRC